MSLPASTQPQIDRVLLLASIGILLAVAGPMLLAPESSVTLVTGLYNWIARSFGLLYQWMAIGCLIVLSVIAFGKYGQHRLGGADAVAEFSTWSWLAMLFCAGICASLLYWSTIEWAFYIDHPPFTLVPGSTEATEWAATYGIFHWGLSAWGIYCLPTVAIAYPYYQQRLRYLRLSVSLTGLFGVDFPERPFGRLVDLVFIIAILGGTGTSLGLVAPMIAACVSALLGVANSFTLQVEVMAIAVLLFGTSVYLGLDRGIKRLSDLNVGLALAFALFVLISGPTLLQLKLATNSIGLMLQEFIRMSTWTDPINNSGFVENWTIFYWAWWLAYAPFVGLFVTRISRGRTLRQLILAMVGFGISGCALFYVTLGNTALWLDLENTVPVRELVAANQADSAIAQVISALPLQPLPLIAFVAMALIFVATTYDSASYTIAASATKNLSASAHPARWHRAFWALALGVLPIALISVGSLKAIQASVLISALPILIIGVLMTISLFRSMQQAHARASP